MTEIDPASTTCLRWKERAHAWVPPDQGGFDQRRYEVAPIAEVPARAFVEAHHYSGSYPAARLRYGLYEGQVLVGVAILSVPVQKKVLSSPFPTLEPYVESLELGRFVLLDGVPANGESWFLGQVFRLARKDGVRGIVSFVDPVIRTDTAGRLVFSGHRGTIYRATNALWAGRSSARSLLLLPDGKILNERSCQKIRQNEAGHEGIERSLVEYGAPSREPGESGSDYLKRSLPAIGVRRLKHGGCHRYLFKLGSAREKKLIKVGLPVGPYPKEVRS